MCSVILNLQPHVKEKFSNCKISLVRQVLGEYTRIVQ